MISFMRTIVDLPDPILAALAEFCSREGISRAEAVRRAVARYLADHTVDDTVDAFGLWAGRYPDALALEDELRGEREPSRRRKPR